MPEHLLHQSIVERSNHPISIALVGCGGNGSRMLSGLRHLHHALEALGFSGLDVTVFDPDTVSESNLARQAFYWPDIGLHKAVVLVNRLNIACGLEWSAVPAKFEPGHDLSSYGWDFLITCVDSRGARAQVAEALENPNFGVRYWLDMGNDLETGQVCLGQVDHVPDSDSPGLPTAVELWPEIADTTIPEADAPSCSTLEALERQDLFVNELVTGFALNLLWRLLRHGKLEFHGGYINASTGILRPIPVPGGEVWTV